MENRSAAFGHESRTEHGYELASKKHRGSGSPERVQSGLCHNELLRRGTLRIGLGLVPGHGRPGPARGCCFSGGPEPARTLRYPAGHPTFRSSQSNLFAQGSPRLTTTSTVHVWVKNPTVYGLYASWQVCSELSSKRCFPAIQRRDSSLDPGCPPDRKHCSGIAHRNDGNRWRTVDTAVRSVITTTK